MDFAAFWLSGCWRKLGRKEAEKRFKAQVTTEQHWKDIQSARDAYNDHCLRERNWYTPMLGSVWFGTRKGWRDWIPDEVEAIADDKEPPPLFISVGIHAHRCGICETPHDWLHADPLCCMSVDVICEEARASMKARTK